MAYFFNAPDFYNMQKDRAARNDKNIEDIFQLSLLPGYYKQSQDAIEAQKERDARLDRYLSVLESRQQETPQEQAAMAQETPLQTQPAAAGVAMLDINSLTPEQLELIYGGRNGNAPA